MILGDSLRAARASAMLFERGINVQPMVAPSVPEHLARLRFFIASTHTDEQLAAGVQALVDVLAELDIDLVTAASSRRTALA